MVGVCFVSVCIVEILFLYILLFGVDVQAKCCYICGAFPCFSKIPFVYSLANVYRVVLVSLR